MRKDIEEPKVDKDMVATLQKALEPVFGKLKLRKSVSDGVYTSYYFKVGDRNININVQEQTELKPW